MTYPERMFQRKEPIPPRPIESTEAVWVDTFEGVLEMLRDLKQATEIAVDLEHHDFRTYTGLVCLMQVSTRAKDWIVDTLQPWRQKLEILNEVFADPNIVKVCALYTVSSLGARIDLVTRYFTARTWTWFGYKGILAFT